MYHVVLHPGQQLLEGLVSFRPVHYQRVALTDGVETDASTQVLHGSQMGYPVGIDGPQQQQPLQDSHGGPNALRGAWVRVRHDG